MTAFPQQAAQWINAAQEANAAGKHEAAANGCRRALKAAPDIPEAWYHLAIAMRGLGRRTPALEALRKARALTANSADAQNSIGLQFLELDARDDAMACFDQALTLAPGHVFAHSNRGQLMARLDRLVEAEAAFRQALALQPDLAPVYVNLGGVLNSRKQFGAAEEACRKALSLEPQSAEAWNNLASALCGQKQLEPALSACRKAVELNPSLQHAWANLGSMLCRLERFAEAEAGCRRALESGANTAQVWSNLAGALAGQRQYQAAEAAARKSLDMDPVSAVAWCNLAAAQTGLNQYPAAEAAGRKSVALDPHSAFAWCNLAGALGEQYRFIEAEAACRRAIEADPSLAFAHSLMARFFLEKGASLEAAAEFRRAAEIQPDNLILLSRQLFWSNYLPAWSATDMLACARQFDRAMHRDVVAKDCWPCSHEPDRTLRVGLVSGDLRRHPVGYLLRGPLREIDQSEFEIHAYSNHATEDNVTAELRGLCKGWTDVVTMSDAQMADRIVADRIDILLDLTGHTEHGRLAVFARRPAPLQASWLGYFASTGITEIDWKIGDPRVTPEEEAGHFTEKLWRLPDSCFCFSPPADVPPVAPLPAETNGYITYACFNNLAKMNEDVVALWSQILRADGTAKLMLKAKQLRSPEMVESVRARYAACGIAPERLRLEPEGSFAEYLQSYAQVDVALDPFPFTGGATTADALWMGVPVLTLKGDRFIAHQGESLLHAAGLSGWIAPDKDAYVAMALSLAVERRALADLRAGLRGGLAESALFDARRYARALEACWRGMWRDLCRSHTQSG